MPTSSRRGVLALVATAALLVSAHVAGAQTSNACQAGKTKCVSKKVKGLLGCHAKAEGKGVAVDLACLQKQQDKFDGGADPAKGCFAKLEAKGGCLTLGDTAALEAKIDAFVEDVVCELDPESGPCPVPTGTPTAGGPTPTGNPLATATTTATPPSGTPTSPPTPTPSGAPTVIASATVTPGVTTTTTPMRTTTATPTATPTPSCGNPGDPGNEQGVGRYCNSHGDCTVSPATVCLSVVNPSLPHTCSIAPCDGTTNCGSDAMCACSTPAWWARRRSRHRPAPRRHRPARRRRARLGRRSAARRVWILRPIRTTVGPVAMSVQPR